MWGSRATGMSGAKKAPPAGVSTTYRTDAEAQFPSNFFAALNQGNDDEALRCMTAEALSPDGSTPSPRAEGHIQSGEWDSKTKVPLVYVDADVCGGRVGDSVDRVCGKARGACTAQTHLKNRRPFVPGWYISLGGKSGHVLTEPFLPAEGGPILSGGAGRLTDGEDKFSLSVGKWKFVIDSWRAAQVEVLAADPFSEGPTTTTTDTIQSGSH